MSLDHELEELIEKSLAKGLEKGVERLIDHGLIYEITKITIDTIEQEICKIVNIAVLATIASSAIGNSLIPQAQNAIQNTLKASNESTISKVQEILINLINSKFGQNTDDKFHESIRQIKDFEKLSTMIQKVVEYETLDDFRSNMRV